MSFCVICIHAVFHSYLRPQCLDLRGLFEFVLSSLSPPGGTVGQGDTGPGCQSPPVLIVDDLSVLLSLGVSVRAVLDFSHYCNANICHELKVGHATGVGCVTLRSKRKMPSSVYFV